jgi:hypothetical protein
MAGIGAGMGSENGHGGGPVKKAVLYLVISALLQGAMAVAEDRLFVGADVLNALDLPRDRETLKQYGGFLQRRKLIGFDLYPSEISIGYTASGQEEKETCEPTVLDHAIRIEYRKGAEGFCGAYIVLLADIADYHTLLFRIRGEHGGENCLIGMMDAVSHEREDAVYAGSIYRYLPGGITREWQTVAIPLSDFMGLDFADFYGLTLLFEEQGKGTVYVDDDIRFSKSSAPLIHRRHVLHERGYMVLDDFDHADRNRLGMRTGCYNKLPSRVKAVRVVDADNANDGKVLALQYHKAGKGWCGYYTLLHRWKRIFCNLADYGAVSFRVKGETGREQFNMFAASREQLLKDEPIHFKDIEKVLPQGVTTNWTRITIPLSAFEGLDTSRMGSFGFHITEEGNGTLYIDDLKLVRHNHNQ